ncbi:hypothetical protein ELJ42_29680, partial [Klebsiella pneumoniae]|nr:hypothetical protein [Klebsiella pneumoniae]
KSGDFYVEAEPKVLVVVRIKGISKLPPKKRSILRLLRLLKINAMTFVRATKATLQMLRLVEDCITFGEPNLKTVKELLYKRGFAKVQGQRIPIQDNAIIEQNLGKHGLVCIEDLVHEIYTCGPHFKQASQFLWPFQLSNPNGGWAP